MNRYDIENNMENARDAIKNKFWEKDPKTGELRSKPINKMMRSKISAFGAMVLMSGVQPAICFFNDDTDETKKAIVDLVAAMYNKREPGIKDHFFDKITKKIEVEKQREIVQENILNDSVSLKLAFNLFELKEMPKQK